MPARTLSESTSPSALTRALRVAIRFVDGLFEHNAFEAAASIAFWFFLSLVPLLVFAGFILGSVVRAKGVDYLVAPLIDIVPGQDAEKLVAFELARMSGARGAPIAPLSVAGFLWTSSSGLHNLMDVFEIAVKVPRRPWWKQRALALGWIVIGLVAVAGTVSTIVKIGGSLRETDQTQPTATSSTPAPPSRAQPPAPGDRRAAQPPTLEKPKRHRRIPILFHTAWEKSLAVALMLAVGTTLLAGFYRFAVEHPRGVRRRAWPGALVAVAGWLLVSWAFGAYVSSLGNYAFYYGSLAAVAVLLIWLYLTSFVLVLGAEVNAHLEGVR